ncbi:E3 ubiquitin-protein ligase BRE1B [Alligator mississippiensis]|uniref:E3 ubiquitin protein ligase n=1 Tax=Alligator mississippiensis TaxID=8496 RepID=A0A151MZ63_ALLMI|nr:E3 ubiquitin-protein ligase BRE1B [Alligator mississippiensis]
MSGAGGKRAAGDGPAGPPDKKAAREEKTTTTLIEPIRLGGVSSTEEMDLKVLQFKNKKLAERLEQRQACEDDLRERIEKLEKRQATDDATLLIVHRYWGQLDENVQGLLRRCDGDGIPPGPAEPVAPTPEEPRPELPGTELEPAPAPEPEGPDRRGAAVWAGGPLTGPALAFVAALGASGREEVELQLQGRVAFSKAAVSRLVASADTAHRRLQELCQRIQACEELEPPDEGPKSSNRDLMKENRRLQDLTMQLQEKHHRISLEYAELQDKVMSSETKVLEMETTVEDLQWDIEKLRKREQKLNKHLAEALEQLNSGYYASGSSGGFQGGQITLSMQKVALRSLPEEAVKETLDYKVLQSQFSLLYNESLQVKTQLDEARALLLTTKNSHLRHIEHMESDELNLQKKLRTEVIQLEDTLAQVRKEYEMLRIEFEQNLAANEQAGPINREMRHLISSLQNHNHQLKGDVQRYKRKLREVQAEINKIRMQSSSFPAAPAAPAPTPGAEEGGGPAPALGGPAKVEEEGLVGSQPPSQEPKKEPKEAGPKKEEPLLGPTLSEGGVVKKEEEEPMAAAPAPAPQPPLPPPRPREPPLPPPLKAGGGRERERDRARSRDRERDREKEAAAAAGRERDRPKGPDDPKKKDSDVLKQLRAELKKAQESQKEMKLLLDMYKSAPKEQRDKVQLMAAERKTKAEVDELRGRARELEERERRESKKLADEDALRRIRLAEEQIEHLQRKLAATKQEEEALLSEMDVTGQAFEDMQEQNLRLLQQLREKDDANFKLMSERIKANQIHKLLRDEKDELADQVLALKAQVDAQLQVVQKLEEKERVLQGALGTVEKELALRSQGLELHKRKAVEAAQLAEDLKVQLEHVQAKVREIQPCVAENRAAKEKESFNLKRAQEDISRLRRKLEKQRKVEVYADADEILQEEIKEYKARLTCPCCNTRKKDAVLTKCFHVFCFECVRTRYESRQRKCPKCNAAFGAHDFHRVYIS